MKKRRIKAKILAGILLFLFVLYWVVIYFLVSAALVPSFMEKLDAFDDITVKSVSEQVHTDTISVNRKAASEKTNEWLSEVEMRKLSMVNADGFTLIAAEFLQEDVSADRGSEEARTMSDSADNASGATDTLSEAAAEAPWVVLLHGYTGWKEEMYQFACFYYEEGYNVLVPDLRCQGESEGDFIGMGYTDSSDVIEWINRAILKNDPDAKIVLHGQSMGASTALIMSGREDLPENVKAIVSDCGYTTGYEMFGDKAKSWFHLPAFPFVDSARLMLLLRGGYDLYDADALSAVKESMTPTLFIHGDADKMISVDMAYELYDACAAEKELLIVSDAGHAQSQYADPEGYYTTIEEFLKESVE